MRKMMFVTEVDFQSNFVNVTLPYPGLQVFPVGWVIILPLSLGIRALRARPKICTCPWHGHCLRLTFKQGQESFTSFGNRHSLL